MFRKLLPLLAALMLATPALQADVTIDPADFPADSADLSGNPYFERYAFVAQGYGQFSGSEYSATTSGTTTIDGVECSVISETYRVTCDEYIIDIAAIYYMARDNDDNIHVLSYYADIVATYNLLRYQETASVTMDLSTIDSTIYYPSAPEVSNVALFRGVATDGDTTVEIKAGCTGVSDSDAIITVQYGYNGKYFSLNFTIKEDSGITQIDDGAGSGFAVQGVSAEAEQYLKLQQLQDADDDDGYCFISIAQMGRPAQTIMTLLLTAVSCLLGWFAIRADRQ